MPDMVVVGYRTQALARTMRTASRCWWAASFGLGPNLTPRFLAGARPRWPEQGCGLVRPRPGLTGTPGCPCRAAWSDPTIADQKPCRRHEEPQTAQSGEGR